MSYLTEAGAPVSKQLPFKGVQATLKKEKTEVQEGMGEGEGI